MQDPIRQFLAWRRRAERAAIPRVEAAALATATARGVPSVRFVLVRTVDERGFVFFTDGRSRKGRELRDNPHAALAIYWDPLGRQVRVEGRVRPVDAAEADAYWESRTREKRLAACSSRQSARLASRAALLAAWRAMGRTFDGLPIPRPPAWTGYRVVPDAIEFWTRGQHRLHHRERFVRRGAAWTRTLLQP